MTSVMVIIFASASLFATDPATNVELLNQNGSSIYKVVYKSSAASARFQIETICLSQHNIPAQKISRVRFGHRCGSRHWHRDTLQPVLVTFGVDGLGLGGGGE